LLQRLRCLDIWQSALDHLRTEVLTPCFSTQLGADTGPMGDVFFLIAIYQARLYYFQTEGITIPGMETTAGLFEASMHGLKSQLSLIISRW